MTTSQRPQQVTQLYTADTNGTIVQLEAVQSRRYRERFFTMFQATTEFVSGLDRPPAYFRTLMACFTTLDPVQYRRVSAREIAEIAKLSQISAERALCMLEEDGIIISNGLHTGAKARRLNNNLIWASTAEKHSATFQDKEIVDTRGR